MENDTDKLQPIRQWAEEDRPREKLVLKGKSVLSDAELIGILIGSGTSSLSAVDVSKIILRACEHDLNRLARLNVPELIKFKGIGPAKAITIVAALELGRRRKDSESVKRPIISASKDAYDYLKPELTDLEHEEFWMIFLKRNNQVIKKFRLSMGGISGTVVDTRLLFKEAIESLGFKHDPVSQPSLGQCQTKSG